MNKLLGIYLIGSLFIFGSQQYSGSTTAATVIAGGIIKTQNINIDKKYLRKNCPVCNGKGWYMSGDGISKVTCGYCEPEKIDSNITTEKPVVHPSVTIKQNCPDGSCASKNNNK